MIRTVLGREPAPNGAATASEPEAAAARRDGFALPLAIMVLALLTMGLVAGFAASTSEMGTASSQRAQARAYSFAQMGLEQFLTRRKQVENSAGQPDTFCKHCWLVNKSAANGRVKANLDTLPTK
jgi:Tfp pilus assembly protein PilX